ncbi:Hypothetical protein, putative [Bodo saltans]|uniref:Membrane-associated protein n=1 Tax=Bodo saltans TaxID=75058 RepID=A0A0S4J6W4_BODSA|nr:Hypothetical protein, putative [Bodo saltans]|eukprot:CUG74453.1 Hypothetical protein, putative [Bodo saltans]
MHFWFSFLCLCVVARQCLAAASLTDGDGVTVIPCTNSVGYYSVLSNNRYVLNCSGSTVAGSEKLPFMNLYPTMMLETEARGISRTSFFENVTILVTGGGMLPSRRSSQLCN